MEIYNLSFAIVNSNFIYIKTYAKNHIIFPVAVMFVSELKLIGTLLYASSFPIQSLLLQSVQDMLTASDEWILMSLLAFYYTNVIR